MARLTRRTILLAAAAAVLLGGCTTAPGVEDRGGVPHCSNATTRCSPNRTLKLAGMALVARPLLFASLHPGVRACK